jgi:hypothetical protein
VNSEEVRVRRRKMGFRREEWLRERRLSLRSWILEMLVDCWAEHT